MPLSDFLGFDLQLLIYNVTVPSIIYTYSYKAGHVWYILILSTKYIRRKDKNVIL